MKRVKTLLSTMLVLVMALIAVSCDNGEPISLSVWDGTIDTTWYVDGKTEYVINEAKELAGLAKLVNEGNTFEGKTISLEKNIDLNNKQWTPIGSYSDKKDFSGIFNGKSHLISGLMSGKVDKEKDNYSYRALFGYVKGKISSLVVAGSVNASYSAGVVAALGDGGEIDGVINKVNVSGNSSIAGICALLDGGGKISNSENYGAVISSASGANDSIGGILASNNGYTLTITGCRNHGCVKAASFQWAGGIVGDVSFKDNASVTIEETKNNSEISSYVASQKGGIIAKVTYKSTYPQIVDCSPGDGYSVIGAVETESTT